MVAPGKRARGRPRAKVNTDEVVHTTTHTEAWAAVRAFEEMKPRLQTFARMVTRNPKVTLHGTATAPHTIGNKIFIRPPLALGRSRVHDRAVCDKRDSDGHQRCNACKANEVVFFFLFHEISHIAFGTSDKPNSKAHKAALAYAKEWHNGTACKHGEKIDEILRTAEVCIELARCMNSYLGDIFNCLEDTRVNSAMFEARPGLRKIFEVNYESIMREGSEDMDGVSYLWSEAPLDAQFMIGLNCMASGYDVTGLLNQSVLDALDDAELREIAGRAATASNANDIFVLSLEAFYVAQRLGFCVVPRCEVLPDPQQPEEPEEGEPQQEVPAGEGPGLGSPEDGSAPGGSGGSSEPGGSAGSASKIEAGDKSNSANPQSEQAESRADDGHGEEYSGGLPGEPDVLDDPSTPGSSDSSEADGGSGEGNEGTEESDSNSGPGTDEAAGEELNGDDEPRDGREGRDEDGDLEDNTGAGSSPGSSDAKDSQGSATGEQPELGDEPVSGSQSQLESSSGEAGPGEGSPYPDGSAESAASAPGDDEAGAQEDVPQGGADAGSEGEPVSPVDEGSDNPWDTPGHDADAPFEAIDGDAGERNAAPLHHGTPEDVSEAVGRFLMHGNDDTDGILGHMADGDEELVALIDMEGKELPEHIERALAMALQQMEYFDTASANVSGVDVAEYPTSSIFWHGGTPIDRYKVPESVLGPAVLKARLVFEENKRATHQRNLRTGRVNTRALGSRAPVGDDRLFKRKRMPTSRSYEVVLGLDASGSTSLYDRNGKIKRAAYAQAELLHRLGVKWSGYAHSAHTIPIADIASRRIPTDRSMYLYILPWKDTGEGWNDKTKQKLSDVYPIAENLDGHTLEYYRKILENSTATDRIIVYYTDGRMPAANATEEEEILRRELATCRRLGITVLGVGINTDSPKEYGLDTVQVDSDSDIIKVVEQLDRMLVKR